MAGTGFEYDDGTSLLLLCAILEKRSGDSKVLVSGEDMHRGH